MATQFLNNIHSSLKPSHKKPAFDCSICSASFHDVELLVDHVQQHSVDNMTDSSLDEDSEMDQTEEATSGSSAQSISNTYPLFTCAICYVSFKTGSALVSHVRHHMTEVEDPEEIVMYMCAICNSSFSSNSALVLHVKGHSSACDIQVTTLVPESNQGKSTTMGNNIKVNNITNNMPLLKQNVDNLLSFQCNICKKYFKNDITLTSHMTLHINENEPPENISTIKKPLFCTICNEDFTIQSDLIDHMCNHLTPKDHHCSTCDKSFNCASHLIRHERIHNGDRPFKCTSCPSAFSRQSHLTTHLRIHEGDKPFVCSVCGKQFTDGSNLVKHNRLHTREKTYKCKTCDKVFSRSDTLAKHNRSHSGEKPYICDLCARPFPRRDSLKRHLMSHRGEKPHMCIVCEQRFTQKYDLTLHYRTHTRNASLPLNWSLQGFRDPQGAVAGTSILH